MKMKNNKKQKLSQENLVSIKKKPLKSKRKKLKNKKELSKVETDEVPIVNALFEPEDDSELIQELEVDRQLNERKVPKIRRSASSENVEENYMIVPWASSEEWNMVCFQFHERNYNDVIAKIGMWQKRVPSLPVGVEATLFLLEAIVYDEKFGKSTEKNGYYTEDQARSLYSLAIIRYLNHVSQLATQSLGGPSKKLTRELAAIVDTPEWLVALRNEVSHAPSAPSIEILRMGGDFVLQWLKQKYWKLPEDVSSSTTSHTPFTVLPTTDDEENASLQICEILAAYIAARIYKMRRIFAINDPEIIRHLPNHLSPVKTKVAVMALKTLLRPYIVSHPSLFCVIVSQELVPNVEFYEDFKSILKLKETENYDDVAFSKLYGVWMPVIKLLESKGKLISVLSNLVEVVINPEFEKMWRTASRWIDKLLEIIEYSGKKYSKHLVNILGILIKHPNYSMQHFLERLFRLTEPRLGSEAVQKLEFLASLWMDEISESKKRRKQHEVKLFTLGDIETTTSVQNQEQDSQTGHSKDKNELQTIWKQDDRSEKFWRSIPIGGVL